MDQCVDCDMAKAKQLNLNKEMVPQSAVPREHLFIDISSTEAESYGKSKYWLLVIDNATDYCWSFFLRQKTKLQIESLNWLKI